MRALKNYMFGHTGGIDDSQCHLHLREMSVVQSL